MNSGYSSLGNHRVILTLSWAPISAASTPCELSSCESGKCRTWTCWLRWCRHFHSWSSIYRCQSLYWYRRPAADWRQRFSASATLSADPVDSWIVGRFGTAKITCTVILLKVSMIHSTTKRHSDDLRHDYDLYHNYECCHNYEWCHD